MGEEIYWERRYNGSGGIVGVEVEWERRCSGR